MRDCQAGDKGHPCGILLWDTACSVSVEHVASVGWCGGICKRLVAPIQHDQKHLQIQDETALFPCRIPFPEGGGSDLQGGGLSPSSPGCACGPCCHLPHMRSWQSETFQVGMPTVCACSVPGLLRLELEHGATENRVIKYLAGAE